MTEDADLISELEADSVVTSGCSVCEWIAARDDAATWDNAFTNLRITASALLRGMRKRGYGFKDKPVQTHRKEKHRG